MKAIKLYPEGTVEVIEQNGLDDLQAAVGGYIQSLWLDGRNDVAVYINEEGKLHGLPFNENATKLMAPILMPGDSIVGTMLFCGFDVSTGENLDVPEDLYELLGAKKPE